MPAVVGVTAKSFEWIEGALSKRGKETISNWLGDTSQPTVDNNWLTALGHLIDNLFGKNPFSWRFVLRSFIASIAFITASWILYTAVGGGFSAPDFDDIEGFAFVWGVCFLVNLVGDYFSLLVSRKIIQWMTLKPRPARLFRLLTLDTVLSLLIASSTIFVQSFYLNTLFDTLGHRGITLAHFRQPLGAVITFYQGYSCSISHTRSVHHIPFCTDAATPYGIYFYSSLFTSLWVWLYFLGGIVVRMLTKMRRLWEVICPYLDIETKPLTAIGRIAALLVGVGYCAVLGFLFLTSPFK